MLQIERSEVTVVSIFKEELYIKVVLGNKEDCSILMRGVGDDRAFLDLDLHEIKELAQEIIKQITILESSDA